MYDESATRHAEDGACDLKTNIRDKPIRMVPIRLPYSASLRVKIFLTGVVFPLGCIIASLCGMTTSVDTPWQSGQTQHYVVLLMRWPVLAPFLPFMLFNMVCIALWLLRPRFTSQSRFPPRTETLTRTLNWCKSVNKNSPVVGKIHRRYLSGMLSLPFRNASA